MNMTMIEKPEKPSVMSMTLPVYNVMIDFETLATTNDAIAFEFAANYFCTMPLSYGPPFMHCFIDVAEQVKMGRVFDPETFRWWMTNGASRVNLGTAIMGGENCHSFDAFLDVFDDFFYSITPNHKEVGIWSRGLGFDIQILKHMYLSRGRRVPWNFRSEYDDRTITKLIQLSTHSEPLKSDLLVTSAGEHDSLYDSLIQSRNILQSIRYFEELCHNTDFAHAQTT